MSGQMTGNIAIICNKCLSTLLHVISFDVEHLLSSLHTWLAILCKYGWDTSLLFHTFKRAGFEELPVKRTRANIYSKYKQVVAGLLNIRILLYVGTKFSVSKKSITCLLSIYIMSVDYSSKWRLLKIGIFHFLSYSFPHSIQ